MLEGSGIAKSILTVGLNGLGYAFEIEKSIGVKSSMSNMTIATLPQKPEVRMVLLDSTLATKDWPIVPFNFELSPELLIAALEKVDCFRIVDWL